MPQAFRYVHVDLSEKKYHVREYKEGFLGPVDVGVYLHLNVYETYKRHVYDPYNVVVIGKGPFAKGAIFGSHRLVVVFRSPLTRGLHVATLGGAAYRFLGVGLDGVVIEGKAQEPTILLLIGKKSGLHLEFHQISADALFKVYREYKGARGTRALTKYLLEQFADTFKEYKCRLIAVGPTAYRTSMAGIYSPSIDYETLGIRNEDWAARGGGGSVFARAHNLVALVYGGEVEVQEPGSRFEYINALILSTLGVPFVKLVTEATIKYNYDRDLKTGGTFGCNIEIYRDRIPALNWNTLFADKKKREQIYEKLREKYLKPFNEQIINIGIWRTCDEPCPVTCKKTLGNKHVDYEPMTAVGPMLGVIDFNEALEILDLVDELGLDAIEVGNVVGWVMEAVEKGLLKPEEVGIEETPVLDPSKWDEEHIKVNKRAALKIVEGLVYGENAVLRLIAEEGIRGACKKLNEMFKERVLSMGIKFEDLAVYVPFGEHGAITPNFYWSPGFFAPLPVLGKYWTYYALTFSDPGEYARVTLHRALMEYLVENAGWCRFHRGWVEKALPHLYKYLYGFEGNLVEHARKYYRMIVEYQEKASSLPEFFEGVKTIKLLASAACEYGAKEWCEKFQRDLVNSAKEWWLGFKSVFYSNLGA